jgi:RimJ/RimL family protein N-acetyltransferase
MMYSGPNIPLRYKDAEIVPFLVEHLGPLIDLMGQWQYAIQDDWRPHAFERFMSMAAAPDSRFYSVYCDGGWQGTCYLTQIVPHRMAWSHGYCTDSKYVFGAIAALRAVNSLAFKELDLDVIYTEHCADNRSITAVARKAGYTIRGTMPLAKSFDGELHDSTILALTRGEWEAFEGRQ